MLTVFRIKQGDRRPYLYATLGPVDANGIVTGQNLTGATVTFNMKKADGTIIIAAGACSVDDALAGEVHYSWQVGDTDESGDFIGEFKAAYGSEIESFPNDRLGFKVKITLD